MENSLQVVSPDTAGELSISRAPQIILEEARKAATALKEVIGGKAKKVMFNGEQYIEAEDWQTIGKFYNVCAKIEWTKFVEFGTTKGWEARAVVIHIPTGKEISAAEAMCLTDERNWGGKPLNQLRSMSQTRATSKALSMVLKWVVVMAGYRATPAEEMDDAIVHVPRPSMSKAKAQAAKPVTEAAPPAIPGGDIPMSFDAAATISEIRMMLGRLNGGDEELMDGHLQVLTKYNDKKSGTQKFLTMVDLAGIGNYKPDWLKGVLAKVRTEYEKAFDAEGNPKQ